MHADISRDFYFFLTIIRIIERKVSLIRAIFTENDFIRYNLTLNIKELPWNRFEFRGRNPRNSLEFSAKKGQRPFIVPTGDRISSRYSFRKWHLLDEKLCSRLCLSWIDVQMEYLFSLDDEARRRKMQRKNVLLMFVFIVAEYV